MRRPSLAILAACATVLAPIGAAAAPAPAHAAAQGARLFADSSLIVGARFSVEVVGQGPDLIFVPGLASSRETWRAAAQRLRGRYRLHLVQIAGFVGEPARANGAGPVLIPTAEALDAYIVDQKLAPAVVIGHSMGGTIALYLAEHHPEHLKKVLLVDALPYFAVIMMGPGAKVETVRPIAERIRTAPPMTGEAQDKLYATLITGQAGRARLSAWNAASDPAAVAGALADDLELDLRPDLAKATTPITVLYPDNVAIGMPPGAADGYYGAAFAALPNKTLRRVDNSLHFIMLDQPAAFAAALDDFLKP